jgi:hypothetical protein
VANSEIRDRCLDLDQDHMHLDHQRASLSLLGPPQDSCHHIPDFAYGEKVKMLEVATIDLRP